MRRRIREAYRLMHAQYPLPEGVRLDLALVYVADKVLPYQAVESALARILKAISAHFSSDTPAPQA